MINRTGNPIVKFFTDMLQCSVCLRVTMMAFTAVVIVELIILIPSCQKFITDWKHDKSSQVFSAIRAATLNSQQVAENAPDLSSFIGLIAEAEGIVGWRILEKDKQVVIEEHGNLPTMHVISMVDAQPTIGWLYIFDIQDFFDVEWSAEYLTSPYEVQLRINAKTLKSDLHAYIARIAGLVVIISAFVTFAVMVALKRVIFSPILKLRDHLNAAKNDLQNASMYVIQEKNRGEVGELYSGLNALLLQIVDDFRVIKTYNESLKGEINERLEIEEELKRSQQVLSNLANYDDLTSLPNRRFALDKLSNEIDFARANNKTGALLFVDLDDFKEINDILGYKGGDELLRQAARRIVSAVRNSRAYVNEIELESAQKEIKSDVIARIGGNEFMVILPDISQTHVESIAERIQKTCAKPFFIQGAESFSTTSIGVSIFPKDSIIPSECMALSDMALYTAKEIGRNCYCFYSPKMTKGNSYRQKVSRELHYALENNELDLHYQPIIELTTGLVKSVEVLLRWNNAELGPVAPDKFIPIAESTGLIVSIGDWVLDQAFSRCNQLNQTGTPVRVAINVSPKQFRNSHFVERVEQLLKKYELPPDLIELEITEGLLIKEKSEATKNIKKLSKLGVKFSIDDFGVGYSSLSYLSRFPVNTLKIDRSFINDILLDEEDAPLVRTIIDMGKNFNLEIIAEGVETKAQVDFLLKHHCDKAQGYFFSMPEPFDKFVERLENDGTALICRIGANKLSVDGGPGQT
jgi:diguanylate cyclase (GGDEF)-like protein